MNGVTLDCAGTDYSQGADGVLITDRWAEVRPHGQDPRQRPERAPLERRFIPWGRVAVVKQFYEEVD